MTCKDCFHYDVCEYHIDEETCMTVNECSHGFKDKSRYIELPCKIGDTVYIIEEDVPDESEPYVLAVKVLQLYVTKHGIAVDLDLPLGIRLNAWAKVGKNVYLTEEDAEKALEERSN